jgi:general secretion pathway protein C
MSHRVLRLLCVVAFVAVAALTFWILKPETQTQPPRSAPVEATASGLAMQPPRPSASEPAAETPAEQAASESALPVQLIGTIIRPNSRASFGTVRCCENSVSNHSEGSRISDFAEVTGVRREKIFLRNLRNGKLEWIRIGAFDPAKQVSTATFQSGNSDKELHVKRERVDAALANLPKLLTEARAVPIMSPQGKIVGFRIDSIQPGSLFEQLGLRDGDEIDSVNGEKIDSAPKAASLLGELRDSSMIILNLNQNGQPFTLRYLIR